MVSDNSINRLLEIYGNGAEHITPSVISLIYENIFGALPPGCTKEPTCQLDDIETIDAIIRTLQDEVIQVDLSHIDATKVVHGDCESVLHLIEILAGYVEYILEADCNQTYEDINNDDDMKVGKIEDENPHMVHKYSPVRREILGNSYDFSSDSLLSVDSDVKNDSAFISGYNKGLVDSSEDFFDQASSHITDKASLLERLNKLPHLTETLKAKGLDLMDAFGHRGNIIRSPSQDNTEDLLNGSDPDLVYCAAQSTPYPKQNVTKTSSDPSLTRHNRICHPDVTDHLKLDKNEVFGAKRGEIGDQGRKEIPEIKRNSFIISHANKDEMYHSSEDEKYKVRQHTTVKIQLPRRVDVSQQRIKTNPHHDRHQEIDYNYKDDIYMSEKNQVPQDATKEVHYPEMGNGASQKTERNRYLNKHEKLHANNEDDVHLNDQNRVPQRVKKDNQFLQSEQKNVRHVEHQKSFGSNEHEIPRRDKEQTLGHADEENQFSKRVDDFHHERGKSHGRNADNVGRKVENDNDIVRKGKRNDSPVSKTPERDLDRSIKERLLHLLDKSGNTKQRSRQVRFDVPKSPRNNTIEHERKKLEFDMQKRLLEKELEEKIDKVMVERKNSHNSQTKTKSSKPKKQRKRKSDSGRKVRSLNESTEPDFEGSPKGADIDQSLLLPYMLEEYPYLQISPHTARNLFNKQVKQINALKSIETERTKIIKKHLQEEEKRQELLLNLMRKELEFTTRQNRKKSILEEKRLLKAKMLERKITTARVRKYHRDYCKRTKAKMISKGVKDEMMFRELFEKGMKIQKERLLEAKRKAKEQSEQERLEYEKAMSELENFYVNQNELLAKEMEEKQRIRDIRVQEKVFDRSREKMNHGSNMKKQIERLHHDILTNEDHLHFTEEDFQRALRRLQS